VEQEQLSQMRTWNRPRRGNRQSQDQRHFYLANTVGPSTFESLQYPDLQVHRSEAPLLVGSAKLTVPFQKIEKLLPLARL